MNYFYFFQNIILQYSIVTCVSFPVKHYIFNLKVFSMSINYIFVLRTSCMIRTSSHQPFLMEVGPVKANQSMKLFYPLFDPSVNDDAAIIFSFSCETTKTLKIRLPPSPLLFQSICFHPNLRPSSAHPPASYHFGSSFMHLLHPPPPCLCELQK